LGDGNHLYKKESVTKKDRSTTHRDQLANFTKNVNDQYQNFFTGDEKMPIGQQEFQNKVPNSNEGRHGASEDYKKEKIRFLDNVNSIQTAREENLQKYRSGVHSSQFEGTSQGGSHMGSRNTNGNLFNLMDNQNPIDIMAMNKIVPEAFHTTEPARTKTHSQGGEAGKNNSSGSGRYISGRGKPAKNQENNYSEQIFNAHNANKPPTPPRKKNQGFHPMKQIQETHGPQKSHSQNKTGFTSRSGHVQRHPTSYSNPPNKNQDDNASMMPLHHANQSLQNPPANFKNQSSAVSPTKNLKISIRSTIITNR
jgi:hypothetical protein